MLVRMERCVKSEPNSKFKVAMVVTRSMVEDSSISRVRIMRSIQEIFEENFDTKVFRIYNLIDSRRVLDWVGMIWSSFLSLISLRPIPLQCVLFSARSEISRLVSEISAGQYDIVYLDSVRNLQLLRALRKIRRRIRVVVDFDDLMSRRMEMLADNGWPISLGYLQNKVPRRIQGAIEGVLSGVIARYEARSLRDIELEICRRANVVVLVSPVECELLRGRLVSGAGADLRSVIPSRAVITSEIRLRSPYRFVFIGSDVHGQNRLSIEYLVELWRRLRPDAVLHIYGRQKTPPPKVHNIQWHGYVEDLRDVYSDDSIALLPALRAGGIKTKMIEAWAFGRPVLANPMAFEGLSVQGYPLMVPELNWDSFILAPGVHREVWITAADLGNSFVRRELSVERYTEQWLEIMRPN